MSRGTEPRGEGNMNEHPFWKVQCLADNVDEFETKDQPEGGPTPPLPMCGGQR